jgi:hypothetical protein
MIGSGERVRLGVSCGEVGRVRPRTAETAPRQAENYCRRVIPSKILRLPGNDTPMVSAFAIVSAKNLTASKASDFAN